MATNPSIILGYHPADVPDPLETRIRQGQLTALAGQQQLQQQQIQGATLENQQRQIALDDQNKLRQAWQQSAGDGDAFFQNAAKAGVSPDSLLKLQGELLDTKTKKASLTKLDADNQLALNTRLQSRLAPIVAEKDPAKQAPMWDQAIKDSIAAGDMKPEEAAQHPFPGNPEGVANAAARLNFEKWSLSQQQIATGKQRTAAADESASKQAREERNATISRIAAIPDAGQRDLEIRKLPAAFAVELLGKDQATLRGLASTAAEQSTAAHQGVAEEQRNRELGIQQQNAATNRGRLNIEQNRVTFDQGAIQRLGADIANGDQTRLKDVVGLRGDQRLQVYDIAKRLNPNFNVADVDRRIKMEDYMTTGKGGENLQSFGTFLQHAGAASDAVNSVRLANSPAINKPINWWRTNMTGDPAYTSLIGALEPVRKEAENFLLNGHAQLKEDKDAANKILSDNSTPAQLQEALKRLGHTAEARYTEMNFRYRKQMGHDVVDPFSPEALAGAQKIGVHMGTPAAAPAAVPGAPAPAPAAAPAPAPAPKPGPLAPKFKQTASGPNGVQIGSNDGVTWFDTSTGKKFQ
jgi:hypothetical protein